MKIYSRPPDGTLTVVQPDPAAQPMRHHCGNEISATLGIENGQKGYHLVCPICGPVDLFSMARGGLSPIPAPLANASLPPAPRQELTNEQFMAIVGAIGCSGDDLVQMGASVVETPAGTQLALSQQTVNALCQLMHHLLAAQVPVNPYPDLQAPQMGTGGPPSTQGVQSTLNPQNPEVN